jgi:hypothetical protein
MSFPQFILGIPEKCRDLHKIGLYRVGWLGEDGGAK